MRICKTGETMSIPREDVLIINLLHSMAEANPDESTLTSNVQKQPRFSPPERGTKATDGGGMSWPAGLFQQ